MSNAQRAWNVQQHATPRPGVDFKSWELKRAINALDEVNDFDYECAGPAHATTIALLQHLAAQARQYEAQRHGRQCRACHRTLWCDCGEVREHCPRQLDAPQPICESCERVASIEPKRVRDSQRGVVSFESRHGDPTQKWVVDGEVVTVARVLSDFPDVRACSCELWRATHIGVAQRQDEPRCPHAPRVGAYLQARADGRRHERERLRALRAERRAKRTMR